MSQAKAGPEILSPLVSRLRAGEIGLALIVKQIRTVDIALAAKTCGFDAIYVDLQHSTIPEDAAAQMSAAAVQCGITPLVRIPKGAYGTALRLLDSGALGIVVPEVETADEAREAVSFCKFAPVGHRSNANRYPQFCYQSLPTAEARRILEDNTLLICMIESEAALNSADAIAAVPGVDVVHIGTSDLSSDIGAPGSNMHPKVLEAVETVVAACRRHNKIPGVGGLGGGDPRNYEEVIRLGARFFSAGNDWALMMSAFQERVNMLRAIKIP